MGTYVSSDFLFLWSWLMSRRKTGWVPAPHLFEFGSSAALRMSDFTCLEASVMRVIGIFSPGEASSTVAPTMSSWVRSTPPGPRFSLLKSAIRLLSWISCGPPGGGLLPWVLESPRTSSWWDAQSDLAMSSSSDCFSW